MKNEDISEIELEELKNTYETAKANYEKKVEEYLNKIDEYNDYANEINAKINELTPTFSESDWIQTTDNRVLINISQFSGEQPYVIWAKLVTSDGTYYEEAIYTMTGTKVTDIDVTGVSLDKTTLSIEEGSSYTLTATIIPLDATNKTLKWSSDNEAVATVLDGKITAKSAGTATITVTTNDGNYTANCIVTVTEKIEEPSSSNDPSIAKDILPHAGSSGIAVITILVISVLGIIFFKKYKYINLK